MDIEAQIIDLYINAKLSELQIARRLSVGHEKVRWTVKKNKIPKRTISEALRYWHITQGKKKEFVLNRALTLEQEKLKLAAVMLYWGEGAKTGNVALANSNPEMVALFVRFLKQICGIDPKRLHAVLHLYSDHDELSLKKFWSKKIGIPVSQFYRSHLHTNTKGSYKKKSQYGTVSVQYSDIILLRQINTWIAEYSSIGKPE